MPRQGKMKFQIFSFLNFASSSVDKNGKKYRVNGMDPTSGISINCNDLSKCFQSFPTDRCVNLTIFIHRNDRQSEKCRYSINNFKINYNNSTKPVQ